MTAPPFSAPDPASAAGSTPSGWHVPPADLAAYRDGSIRGVSADSVEAHLLRCDHCRAVLAAGGSRAARDRRWEVIAAAVDQPTRWSRNATWLRLAVGTPHLAIAAGVLAVVIVAVPLFAGLSGDRAAITWFVALAPAVPIAAAVLAYGSVSDPSGAIGRATPLHSFRLVILRTGLLLTALLPIGLIASVLLPVRTSLVLGWFLPALAACAVVLAVGTRHDPVWVAGGLAGGWAVVVLSGLTRLRSEPLTEALEQVVVNQPVVQVASLVIAVDAIVLFVVRRDDVTYRVTP